MRNTARAKGAAAPPAPAAAPAAAPAPPSSAVRAIALLNPDGGSGVSGVVHFSQDAPGKPTVVRATVNGLKAGKHGIHVHQFGNLSQGCVTAGPHYNPFNKAHGGPADAERHVGMH
jgi:superoxide dismutase, Cu-Zn family